MTAGGTAGARVNPRAAPPRRTYGSGVSDDSTHDMTDEQKRRDQLLAAPKAVEHDADPRIDVSHHDRVTRIDVRDDAAVRPGNPYDEEETP